MAAASPRTARRTSSTRSCATTRSRRERSGARMVGLAGQAAAHALSSGGTSPRATYSLYVRSRFLCSSAAICASSDGAASSLLAMLERRTPLRTAALPESRGSAVRGGFRGGAISAKSGSALIASSLLPRRSAGMRPRSGHTLRSAASAALIGALCAVPASGAALCSQSCENAFAECERSLVGRFRNGMSIQDAYRQCREQVDKYGDEDGEMCAAQRPAYRPLTAPPRPRDPPRHRYR